LKTSENLFAVNFFSKSAKFSKKREKIAVGTPDGKIKMV